MAAQVDPSGVKPESPPPPSAGRGVQVDAREPVTILMVDDQPSKLISYEVILSELGERLIKATSGREALDHLLKSDVAVVLMDVSMPEIDGFELADMMRQHPRFQKTPIIFVSAVHLTDVDRIRGYQSGAVDYISVPVIPDVLRAKVSVFAELHRKTRQLRSLNRDLEMRVAQRSEELRVLNEQLQQRVAELESIMQVLPVGVAVAHGSSAEFITGNTALSEMLGLKQGDNLSRAFSDLPFHPSQNDRVLPAEQMPVQHAVLTGQPTGMMEFEIDPSGNGVPHHLLASASPLFDQAGNVRGAVCAFFDVTERMHMENTLRERAELLELASEAIMVHDASGVIRFWNAGAEGLYGWTREEAIGQNAHELLGTETPGGVQTIADALQAHGRWEGNLKQRRKEGYELIVASRHAVQMGSAAVLEINRDITTQLIAEEALRRNERLAAMGKLAGIVAHEINNPLEAITNLFYLLRTHSSLDDEAKCYAELADQELARVSHITKQTLSFYRQSQDAVPVFISDLLDNVLELQQRPIELSHIQLEKRYVNKGMVNGFPSELKQVFMNLVSNAIQAMPDGGRMRICVREAHWNGSPGGVSIFISDTGSGIAPEDAKRLFEPFFTTKSVKGTGLGLWISRGIVQKHDGVLRFRSMRAKSGAVTAFHIWLPGDLSSG
ncbi:MAG TPA: ATP-binding protein [Acidobacteriaceae bacterium]|jgi:PAS domain S-box-containing protein|nr:ATP-binding protein [Acidobacteriaceae bacterium]